jgi:hypothetical protein
VVSSRTFYNTGLSNEIWKTRYILIDRGSNSLKLTSKILSLILNGLSFFQSSLLLGRFVLMFRRSK